VCASCLPYIDARLLRSLSSRKHDINYWASRELAQSIRQKRPAQQDPPKPSARRRVAEIEYLRLNGKTYKEIANIFGISITRVRQLIDTKDV
jgi:DNA-binding CsgD family transcriptional regulator